MSNLENPFRKSILPPEQTDPEANAVLADTLLGKEYGDALRSLDADSVTKHATQKQDDFSDMTFNEEELHIVEQSQEVSPIEAESIMGREHFFGSKAIEKTFGFTSETAPHIPFSVQELQRAKELGMQLILNIDKDQNNTPMTIEHMAILACKQFPDGNVIARDAQGQPTNYLFYKDQFNDNGTIKSDAWFKKETGILNETPHLEWQLVSEGIIEGSANKNYLDQQELLIDTIQEQLFNGSFLLNSPEQKANEEFERERPRIQQLIDEGKTKEASDIISQLQSSKLFREPITHTIFRYLVNFNQSKQLFADGNYTWSKSVSSDGGLLHFGSAGADGADVGRDGPWGVWSRRDVVLSLRR